MDKRKIEFDVLKELERIKKQLDIIGNKIQFEERVLKEELEARLKLNLSNEDALEHYNRWMLAAGLKHLVIKK